MLTDVTERAQEAIRTHAAGAVVNQRPTVGAALTAHLQQKQQYIHCIVRGVQQNTRLPCSTEITERLITLLSVRERIV